jgi:hypothetical protein
LEVLKGHDGLVHSAGFSADGTKIITASWDKTVRVWDAKTYEPLKVLPSHSRDINFAAFSRDGERIVTASDDGTARVWDARTYDPWQVSGPHDFGKRLFAISAVSGGSLAAVLTYAALADARPDTLTRTGVGLPPCTQEGLRKDEEWFGAQVRGRQVQPANPVQSWRDCLQLLSAGDFLSPVFVSLVSNDPLRIGWRGNRAAVLEHAWEARYARLTGKGDDGLDIMFKRDGDSTLAQSLSTVRRKAAERNTWLPILLLNGTSVETGRRIVTSDVDTLACGGNGQVPDRVFADSYDLHELFRPTCQTAASVSSIKDIRLSTAATMSARFPFISPPGVIIGKDGKDGKSIVDRVVDGGYYENFGATTAMELANALRQPDFKLRAPIILLITNDPHTSKMECVTEDNFDYYPRSYSTPWFPTFSSPLDALLGTRNARATHAAVNLCKALKDRFGFVSVQPDPKSPDKDLSLSWWLSKRVQKALDEQIDGQHNFGSLAKINPRRVIELKSADMKAP